MSRHNYRSGFEHLIGADLSDRGIQFEYEAHTFKFLTRVRNGICSKCDCKTVYQRRTYTPDYKINNMHIEAKGILDSKTRSKMRDFKKANPEVDVRFLFTGKEHYKQGRAAAAWCQKFGFRYAFGPEVPEEWL